MDPADEAMSRPWPLRGPWWSHLSWAYEPSKWDDIKERLAAISVCEFLLWGGR